MSHKIRICRTKSHKIRTKLQYAGQYPTKVEYRMARIFRGIQFLQKAHLQRFRDLIFADGRFRVAPPTIPLGSASYCTCAAAQISLELVEKSYEKSAIDRICTLIAEVEKWHESCIWFKARDICVEEALGINARVASSQPPWSFQLYERSGWGYASVDP